MDPPSLVSPVLESDRSINFCCRCSFSIQGRPAEAAALLSEVVEGYKETLGPNELSTITALGNLGLVLHHSGRLEEALPCLKESLAAKRSVGNNPLDPEILSSVNNLGNLYKSMGLYSEAEPLLREAVDGYRATLGDGHPSTYVYAPFSPYASRFERKISPI